MPLDQTESRSSKVREKLDHPVDGNGHTQEYHPILIDYLKAETDAAKVLAEGKG